jgi:hypothetical protein
VVKVGTTDLLRRESLPALDRALRHRDLAPKSACVVASLTAAPDYLTRLLRLQPSFVRPSGSGETGGWVEILNNIKMPQLHTHL